MMKFIYKILLRKTGQYSKQEELIRFVTDTKNIEKAAEGSMQKRIDLINKAELKQAHSLLK